MTVDSLIKILQAVAGSADVKINVNDEDDLEIHHIELRTVVSGHGSGTSTVVIYTP